MKYNPTKVDGNDEVRYTIEQGERNRLFVIGLNPSTADIQKADPTMRRVVDFANRLCFDGFVMLNLYPQRATCPDALHREMDETIHQANIAKIKHLISQEDNPIILVAYGDKIGVRKYLSQCLEDIIEALEPYHPQWICLGNLTKLGNPRHPLYVKADTKATQLNYENGNKFNYKML